MKSLSITLYLIFTCSFLIITAVGRNAPTASIHGHILDSFGFPIADTTLEIQLGRPTQIFQIRTDREGNYKLDALPEGEYVITVFSRGFITESKDITLSGGIDMRLDFGLIAGYLGNAIPIKVSGMVRQFSNVPLQDATVTLISAFNQRFTWNARTDKTGRYQINVDYPGQYIIYVSKPGLMVNSAPIVLPANLPREQRIADFVLTPLRAH
jgi:hypothetical protein